VVHLLAAELTPFSIAHIARRDDSDQTAREAAKHDEGQPAVKRFAQGNVAILTGSSELILAGKNFFDFVGAELVPLDVEDVIVIPVKPRNDHTASVA